MTGLSRSNMFYMRAFAAAWPEAAVVQAPVGQLPWGHITVLVDKLNDQAERDWYAAAAAARDGWSRNVLLNMLMGQLHSRAGAAPSNFRDQLPAAESDLAQQMTRDPYVLDFLELTQPAAERDLESALVTRLQTFLLELGHGFAFVGRQYHFEVDGDDFSIDLLFFNWAQSRFVVIELKIGRFQPEHTGKLGFYVAWVDENLRDQSRHSPTIGILLCTGRNDNVPGAPGLLRRALAVLPAAVCGRPRVRADAGYFDGALARAAIDAGCDFSIAAKRNTAVGGPPPRCPSPLGTTPATWLAGRSPRATTPRPAGPGRRMQSCAGSRSVPSRSAATRGPGAAGPSPKTSWP